MTLLAAVQMTSGSQVPENLDMARRHIASAAASGARLVVLPENFALMPLHDADRLAAAESIGKGPIQDFLAEQARKHKVWLVGGTLPLATDQGTKVRATCLVFDDLGKRVARYDKIHLFDVQLDNGEQYHESSHFESGNDIVSIKTPFGMLGLAVCYDLRFPELFRRLADQGVELIAIPSAFTAHTGKAHWEILVRARAIENSSYIIAAAQVGRHANNRETFGDSMIVNPWGEIVARRQDGTGPVVGAFDRSRLLTVRKTLPSLQHRRVSS